MNSEAAHHADFTQIRYAQVWEDADILLDALDIQPGDTCLSIASAGDNALALLTRSPARVIAIDLNPSQLACLELRVAAYRALSHPQLLELIGSKQSSHRVDHYLKCRPLLASGVRDFWDRNQQAIINGIGSAGKFERYFALFREKILPWIHSRSRIEQLLKGGSALQRQSFYDEKWDTWRWRILFKLFFSRFIMGHMGRDPSFFRYVEGSVGDRILARTSYALTELNPADNPYLQWILTGTHTTALPCALRPENFELIRTNLDRMEWRCQPAEQLLEENGPNSIDRFNLSDIFEYMSEENSRLFLEKLVTAAKPGARLAYWNMLAPRRRPESMSQ
ncbi:MAG: S-adenosylmethionine:diacylglycerol 3-amino-3-carboxypropyl transferase, partial [Chthoniobacteraceae bacterium]|nr:S-adenosylmethionine:diacylglycerol 3-amino-3-carboxypropyl transferase [Chthoniobacteraceae bacterium]